MTLNHDDRKSKSNLFFFIREKKRFIILLHVTHNYLSIILIVIADALSASIDVFFRIVR